MQIMGQHPALLDAPDSVVKGAAYHVSIVEDGEKLAAYKTSNHRTERYGINYMDREGSS